MRNCLLILRILKTIYQGFKKLDMFLIQAAVGAQITERSFRQIEKILDAIGCSVGKIDAGSLQHQDHAKKPRRIYPVNLVVGERNHHFSFKIR